MTQEEALLVRVSFSKPRPLSKKPEVLRELTNVIARPLFEISW